MIHIFKKTETNSILKLYSLEKYCRPTKAGTEGPFFCNESWVFNPDGVQAIRPQLLELWPNIHGNDTEDSLWKHEWEKHGTCASLDSHFSSELLYFQQGIQWVRKTN